MTIEAVTLLVVVVIAIATAAIVCLAIRQARRTTQAESRMESLNVAVHALDERIRVVGVQCDANRLGLAATDNRLEVLEGTRRR